MKKAKIILAAVGIFAVVGGAFAFKANKFVPLPYYQTYATQGTIKCSANPSITTSSQGVLTTIYRATNPNGFCLQPVTTFTTTTQQL